MTAANAQQGQNRSRTAENFQLATVGVSTVAGVLSALDEGKIAKEIAKSRAEIDIRNAEAVREASEEQAKIISERGIRFLATQKSTAAAGNIRINVGSPMVIAAETRAAIAKEKGFTLKAGRVQSEAFRARARNERAVGRSAVRRSRQNALALGIRGFNRFTTLLDQRKEPDDTTTDFSGSTKKKPSDKL